MTTTIADRRQMALQRLHGGAKPAGRRARRTRGDRREPGLRTIPFWDVQRGPAPAAFYVLAVVVSLFVVIGLVGLWLAQRINLAFVRKASIPVLALCSAAMVLPMVPGAGVTINGAKAWIMVGPFSVQPSEFLKLAVVIFAADLLMRREEVLN